MRKLTREITVGDVKIGGNNPIVVQTMNSLPLSDVKGNINQIIETVRYGNEIIRVALPDFDQINYFKEIVKNSPIPVIADIHFHHKLVMEALKAGAKGIRINPGNFGSKKNLTDIIKGAKDYGAAIRVGVNSGSLDKNILKTYGERSAEALVFSALEFIKIFEDNGFFNMKISLKSSDVRTTIKAYKMFSERSEYPLHIGVTEAGPIPEGIIKSSVALGNLLLDGIGDTIRISLTAPPEEEVRTCWNLLGSLDIRRKYPEIISCPLCGRASIRFEEKLKEMIPEIKKRKLPIKVAIMGCEVNGPGEAKEADLGIAFSHKIAYLFKNGNIYKKGEEDKILNEFLEILKRMESET